jgi:hypothetical protein
MKLIHMQRLFNVELLSMKLKGLGRNWPWIISRYSPGDSKETNGKPKSGYSVYWSSFEQGTSRIHSLHVEPIC